MASMWKILRTSLSKNSKYFMKTNKTNKDIGRFVPIYAYILGCSVVGYSVFKWHSHQKIYAAAQNKLHESKKTVKFTSRERRFIRLASVEYDGQLYMTPKDFLESVVEQEPKPRLKRRVLTIKEIKQIADATPSLKLGSAHLFRNLNDKGIISYTEYLFLLSILTKPESGFRIAFNMFDTDGNQRVDKTEFLVLEKIISSAWKGKHGISKNKSILDQYVDDEQGFQRKHLVDTTIAIHFFGVKGTKELRYEGFKTFMENLQTEVLELEFGEFSQGLPTITEMDFAKILLRYTQLDTDKYDMYLDRLQDRMEDVRGITFEEFHLFCQFLYNLEDFSTAMHIYTLAGHRISQDEFHRAAKICTGTSLSDHLVHTVFAIFDEDGDGQLSHKEFIAIMKARFHRGCKLYAKNEGWDAFKICLKQEMTSPV